MDTVTVETARRIDAYYTRMSIPYPPGMPPMSARVHRNVSSTAGLASYAHRIGE